MFGRIGIIFEMIKVVELEFQSAFAALEAIGSIESTGFRTL
jgi:hypothetical protein